ncbi:MAG: hypothetical protein VB031_09825 [Eubacteriaceae bacterium]|nr:hypothetical protein [Eubacteriaceae bacterium]
MKVYALSGKSGTGKSYQAMNICREKGIESIIDDGLFIYKNEIQAGKSAKREDTKIGAVKTALFHDDDHRDQVVRAIKKRNPASILVIGTSDGMIYKIINRLKLQDVDEMIHIEDITTEKQREIAGKQRSQQGKHVVPAPSVQLKRQFSGYFMHPMRMFKGWNLGRDADSEKSVVRPTYSYLGNFFISDRVITDIVEQTADRTDGIAAVIRTFVENRAGELRLTVLVTTAADRNAFEVCGSLQERCTRVIGDMTAFNVKGIDVEVRGLG